MFGDDFSLFDPLGRLVATPEQLRELAGHAGSGHTVGSGAGVFLGPVGDVFVPPPEETWVRVGKVSTDLIAATTGTAPQSNEVDVWRVGTSGTLEDTGENVRAYNFTDNLIKAGEEVLLLRDPASGLTWAVPFFGLKVAHSNGLFTRNNIHEIRFDTSTGVGFSEPADGVIEVYGSGGGSGTVTSVSVAGANGLAGSVANATTTPAITLSTTITGVLKGDGTAISAAAQGTDYYAPGGTDVAAADGGTGRSSHTAYAVICGGTAATGPQQSVASVGTAGQVLTSNGAGALPTWQAASGGVSDGDKGDITVSGGGTVWEIDPNAVGNAELRQSAGLSLVGRSANSAGNVADITSTQDNQVMRRSGTSVGWGPIDLSSVNAVTGRLGNANGGVPVGAIAMFAVVPSEWLECDGSAVSRTTYSSLFAVLGTTFGAGDGSTTFNLPDFRSRSPVGAGTGAGLSPRTVGGTAGAETHTLTLAQLPAHSHGAAGGGNLVASNAGGGAALAAGTGYQQEATTASAGGGAAHNIMHPVLGIRLCIKT